MENESLDPPENAPVKTEEDNDSQECIPKWGSKKRMRIARPNQEDMDSEKRKSSRNTGECRIASADEACGQASTDFVEETMAAGPSNTRASGEKKEKIHHPVKKVSVDRPRRENRGRPPNCSGGKLRDKEEVPAAVEPTGNNVRPHRQHGGENRVQKGSRAVDASGQDRRVLQHNLESTEEAEIPKFSLCLSRLEKEADFIAMKGTKLPQRPKKRSKGIEKLIQRLHPGTWLTNLKKERYEVRERKIPKKRPRGLRGMQADETDSNDS